MIEETSTEQDTREEIAPSLYAHLETAVVAWEEVHKQMKIIQDAANALKKTEKLSVAGYRIDKALNSHKPSKVWQDLKTLKEFMANYKPRA